MKATKYVLNVNFFSKVFQILCFSYKLIIIIIIIIIIIQVNLH